MEETSTTSRPRAEAPQRPPRHQRIIHPYDRIYWDIFVFLAIGVSAFEIPYDWLVGWEDGRISLVFDLIFFTVFFTDMVLNSLTMRERSFSGFWGIRNVAGLFHLEWSKGYHRKQALKDDPKLAMVLDTNPEIFHAYARSGWFIIDLLSTIPWGLLAESFSPLTSLRLLRVLRLARLFRVLRLTKAIYLLERIRRAIPSVPSVERLLFITMSIPWIAHMLACLTYYFEREVGHEHVTYWDAFHAMWMAIIARKTLLAGLSTPSFFIGILGVVISVFIITTVTGNLAALFTSLDFGRKQNHHIVLENHSVVIGWNNNVFAVIQQQLHAAQEGQPGDIVLLSRKTEAEVWKEFDEFGLAFDPRRLTIHTGSVQSVHNIRKLSVGRARNVILLGSIDEDDAVSEHLLFRRADTEVLKTLLACCNAFNLDEWARVSRRKRGYLSMVAAVHSRKMASMLQQGIPRRSRESGFLDIHIVDTEDILSRCITQVAAEPMMSELFRELFSYTHSGAHIEQLSHEVYIIGYEDFLDLGERPLSLELLARHAEVEGFTFADLAHAMPEAIPIGYYTQRDIIPASQRECYGHQRQVKLCRETRSLILNPGFRSDDRGHLRAVDFERDHVFERGDALIVIAQSRPRARIIDPERIGAGPVEDFEAGALPPRAPRNLMVLGNGNKVGKVLELLPDYLPRGSDILAEIEAELSPRTLEVMVEKDISMDAVTIRGLRDWDTGGEDFHLRGADTVVVMSGEDNRHRHDANILMALTALESNQQAERGDEAYEERDHVIELLDAHNVELADAFGRVSSLISPELVSNYLVQVANNPERGLVYMELMDIEGNEFYIVPLSRYLTGEGEDVAFDTLARRANALGEIAVGYAYETANEPGHLRLCPMNAHRTAPRSELYRRYDEHVTHLVVLAACYPGG